MAITKMEAVTIAGPIDDFERTVEKYVYGRDIHLENAMSVLTNRGRLHNFENTNEYDIIAKNAQNLMKLAGCEAMKGVIAPESVTPQEMQSVIDEINEKIESEKQHAVLLSESIKENEEKIKYLELMLSVDIDLSKLLKMEFIQCRFGRIPKTGYKTLNTYLDSLETFFIETASDETDVWGFYFAPLLKARKVEEIFNSLYFEPAAVPEGYSGTPKSIRDDLIKQTEALKTEAAQLEKKMAEMVSDCADKLCGIYNLAKKRRQFAQIRQNAVHSDMFFYVVGWMDKKSAKALEAEIMLSGDEVLIHREEPSKVSSAQPPTKLKNNSVFRPFEMFVKMYGLPSYNEIDPTPILAITYILFFGIMFGDVGQAAVLSIVGFILYKIKKWDLCGIIGTVGISGIVFGFVYGSFFGNEEIIPRLLHTTPIQPMEQAITMLIATIAIGALIIIFGMVLNVINAVKRGDIGEMLFGHNGIAGIVFYVSMLLLALNMILKLGLPNKVFTVLLVVSVLVMYMCEPLSKLLEGKKDWLPKDGMFFVENLFELFEVVLSFFTNTLSFLRIGAFSIVHVGMMMVVAVLSKGGGVGGVIVMIIGNILVMALEGLIVGIQVLRLEYYEMFSRYFSGRGREFKSLSDKS